MYSVDIPSSGGSGIDGSGGDGDGGRGEVLRSDLRDVILIYAIAVASSPIRGRLEIGVVVLVRSATNQPPLTIYHLSTYHPSTYRLPLSLPFLPFSLLNNIPLRRPIIRPC